MDVVISPTLLPITPTPDNHLATKLSPIRPPRLPTLDNHTVPTLLPLMPTLDNHTAPTLLPLMPTLDNHTAPTLLPLMPTLVFGRTNLMVHNHNLCKYSKCYISEIIKDEKFNEGNWKLETLIKFGIYYSKIRAYGVFKN